MGMTTQYLLDHGIEALCLGALALLTFLVRSFFTSIRSSIDKLSGRFDAIDARSNGHGESIAVIKSELRAVWRTMDPPQRLSDHINGEDEE